MRLPQIEIALITKSCSCNVIHFQLIVHLCIFYTLLMCISYYNSSCYTQYVIADQSQMLSADHMTATRVVLWKGKVDLELL